MGILFIFIIGFIGGQITAMTVAPGVRVSLLDVAVLIVLLYGAYRSRKKRFIPKLWLPILLFAFVSILSGGDLLYITRWLLYVALYWVAADNTFSPSVWENVLITSGVGIALLGFVQYFLYPDLRNLYYLGWDPHFQRLFSTLLDPNFAGIILAITALLTLASGRRVAFVITLAALLLTFSRSSYLAFASGFVVWWLSKRKSVMAFVAFGEGQNLFRSTSSLARIDSARYAWTRFLDTPIFGHGFRAHAGIDTSLLFVLESTGVLGFVVYSWLLRELFRLKGLQPTLVAILVHSVFVNSLFYPWLMAWIWIMAGISRDAPFLSHSRQGRGR